MTEFVPYLRPGEADESFWRATYEQNSFGAPLFAPDDLVIDLGAGVGSFSRRAWENGSRNVLAFEIDPEFYAISQRNLAGCEGVSVYHEAVLGEVCPPTVRYRVGSCSLWAEKQKGKHIEVPTVTFDAVVGRGRTVRFLKINVEGAEWEIFYTSNVLSQITEISGQAHEQGADIPGIVQDPFLPEFSAAYLKAYLEDAGFRTEFSEPDPGHVVYNFHAWRK